MNERICEGYRGDTAAAAMRAHAPTVRALQAARQDSTLPLALAQPQRARVSLSIDTGLKRRRTSRSSLCLDRSEASHWTTAVLELGLRRADRRRLTYIFAQTATQLRRFTFVWWGLRSDVWNAQKAHRILGESCEADCGQSCAGPDDRRHQRKRHLTRRGTTSACGDRLLARESITLLLRT